MSSIHKLLTYQETVWRENKGYKTKKVQVRFDSIQTAETIKEQTERIEKLSLVVFLNKEQNKKLANICRHLKRNDSDFHQNRNLHVTVLGFGPLAKPSHKTILKRIQQFTRKRRATKLTVTFNKIKPGTMYSSDIKANPISGPSNGTVVALGEVDSNKEFYNYTNELAKFLSEDKKINSILGVNFRKKLPSVWCTMGYYSKPGGFRINEDLETFFKKYSVLDQNPFMFSFSEISLVKSKFKNLSHPTILHNFKV